MTDKNLPPRKRQVPAESSKQDAEDSSDDSGSASGNSDDSQSPNRPYSYPSGYPQSSSYPAYDPKANNNDNKRKAAPVSTAAASNRQPRQAALNKKKYVERDADSDDDDVSDDDDDGPVQPAKRAAVTRPANEQVYCMCRKPDHGGFMIGCDICDEWFHGDCVKINEARSRQIAKYVCEKCERKGPARTELLPTKPVTAV